MAVPINSGVTLSATGKKLHEIVKILVGNESGYYITSGQRSTNDYHGSGQAIDIGFGGVTTAGSRRGRDLAQKLYKYFADTLELIHTTPYDTDEGFYVKHGSKVGWNFYGAATNNAHKDHVHFAANSAQADRILAKVKASPPTTPESNAEEPPALVEMKKNMLAMASVNGLDGLQFLGIAPGQANAYGYHNSRARHLAGSTTTGSGDYSIQLSLDKEGDAKFFSAIDLGGNNTKGKAATRVMTQRLKDAIEAGDERTQYVREFYGTLNGSSVFGRTHSSLGGNWSSSSSDDSHLFHLHVSLFRKYNNHFGATRGLTEVLLGLPKNTIGDDGAGNGNGTPAPGPSYNDTVKPIFGWDASDFDHNRGMRDSHVTAAAKEGIVFFTHKVTEGTRTIHVRCGGKLEAARKAGIPFIGAYVVTRTPGNNSNGSISAQVDYAIDELNKQWPAWKTFPGFFWQVDLEHWPYDQVSPAHGAEMCKLLESKTGKKAVLYAPRWAYRNTIPSPWNAVIWNSHYVNGSGAFKSLYPGDGAAGWATMSGKTPVILQYSSSARIGGQHTCDANAYRGTAADFAKLVGAKAAPGTPTPEEEDPLAAISGNEDAVLEKIAKAVWANPIQNATNNDEPTAARVLMKYAHKSSMQARDYLLSGGVFNTEIVNPATGVSMTLGSRIADIQNDLTAIMTHFELQPGEPGEPGVDLTEVRAALDALVAASDLAAVMTALNALVAAVDQLGSPAPETPDV